MHVDQARLRVEPRRHGALRLGVFALAERFAGLMGGRALYRRVCLGPKRLRLREERLRVRDLPGELEGFRLLQLSDFHAGALLGQGSLEHVIARANALQPDLIVLTGDYVTQRWSQALALLEDLGRLRARLGIFAVFGNHDYRGRNEGRIAEAFAERGIRFLRNQGVRFEIGSAGLTLCGLEDLEESRGVDLAAARELLRQGDVEIDLCHNPRRAPLLARAGVAAIFSGHTHGSQVDAPWLRRLGPPHPGARTHLGETLLVTSRGLGVVGFPLRWRAPAEIVLARLERLAPEAAA